MFKRALCMMALTAVVFSAAGCGSSARQDAEKSGDGAQDSVKAESTDDEALEDELEEDELEEEELEEEEVDEAELTEGETDEYTAEELEKMACMDVDEDSLSDFIVSDPITNVIWYDMNNDMEDERIIFEFNDLGDEAVSFIKATVELPTGNAEAVIDGAYGLYWVCAAEDEDGPLLDIGYEMGDAKSHEEEGLCSLKLRNGGLIVDYEDME